jgi:erythromycin esterase
VTQPRGLLYRIVDAGALLALSASFAPAALAAPWSQAAPVAQSCVFTPEERAAIARWLDTNAVAISTSHEAEAGGGGSGVGVAGIARAIDRASIVGLGEATHGSQEEQVVRFELVRALVAAGKVSTIALEANRLPLEALNQYIQGGLGDPVRAMSSPAFFATLRTDEFVGLLQWLRQWNSEHPERAVTIVGVDIQDPANELRAALALVENGLQGGRVAQFRKAADPLLAERGAKLADWLSASSYDQHQAQIRNARALRDFIATDMPAQRRALMLVQNALAGLEAFEYYPADARSMPIPPDFIGRRDRAIARNVQAASDDGRLIFLAHDTHVIAAPASYRSVTAPSVGGYLRDVLGAKYVSVNFAWDEGAVSAIDLSASNSLSLPGATTPSRSAVSLPSAEHGDLAFLLKEAKADSFWFKPEWLPPVPWGSKLRTCPLGRRWVGAAIDPGTWRNTQGLHALGSGTDVLIWIGSLSPVKQMGI